MQVNSTVGDQREFINGVQPSLESETNAGEVGRRRFELRYTKLFAALSTARGQNLDQNTREGETSPGSNTRPEVGNVSNKLEPLSPDEAVQMYKQDRADELAKATLQSHGYRLDHFVDWCDENDVTNLNELTGRDIHKFKLHRKVEVNTTTLKSQMDTLRVFLRFCAAIDGVRDGIDESVQSPTLTGDDGQRSDIVPAAKAEDILTYLDRYEYASRRHVVFRLYWETGMRMGASRAIDLDDLHLRDHSVELVHRPYTDTPLKNKERGEREVALTKETCRVLRDYLDEYRHDVTDDHGRNPFLTTKHGRVSKNTLRAYIYRLTRPCEYNGGDCPHGRSLDECEARQLRMTASKCPSSTAPHSVRRGAITHYLQSDVPAKVVSDRMDVSQDVIDEHYNERSERAKMEQRRRFLDNI